MVGQIAQSMLRGRTFDLATPDDLAEIQRVLRDNPMDGAIRLSIEPLSFDYDAIAHQTIVGRRAGGGLFGLGMRSVRRLYVNGASQRVAYLSTLRIDRDYRNRARVLRGAYGFLRELHEADDCPLTFTSIMSDNAPARRFLEAGLKGMPTYRFVGDYSTLIMRVRHRSRFKAKIRAARPVLTSRAQFACVKPLSGAEFRAALDNFDRPVAWAALCDCRSAVRTVVRGYAPALARWRPILNFISRCAARPRLPEIGQPLQLAYLAHVGISEASSDAELSAVVESLFPFAVTRGIDYFVAGFPSDDRLLRILRARFGGRVLRSRIYTVSWSGGEDEAESLDGRPIGPEVALL